MDDSQILGVIEQELTMAIGGSGSSVQQDRREALEYYLGNKPEKPSENIKASGIVSTDVADAIEWIMPEVVKSFTQTNEVVAFDPVAEGDEDQADMETDYTYGVLMKENEGFIAIHTLIKDCLMQKNGIIKVFFNNEQEVTTESYTGLSKQQLQQLVSSPEVEIMNMTGEALVQDPVNPNEPMSSQPHPMDLEDAEKLIKQAQQSAHQQVQPFQAKLKKVQEHGQRMQQMQQQIGNPQPPAQHDPKVVQMQQMQQKLQQQSKQAQQQIQQIMAQVPKIIEVNIDVKVKRTCDKGKVEVIPVPPEEFRITSRWNSVNPKGAPFTAHVSSKTRGELLKVYPDSKTEIESMSARSADYDETYRFYEQNENDDDTQTIDKSQDDVDVFECYLTVDVDDDGIGKMMQVICIGDGETPIYILEKNEIDCNPFVAATAILMSHKFLGLSVYDRLKEIQDEKTQLWRNINDNIALINNKEYEVVEGKVNLDDLLVSRPGGIKRVKAPGMLREIVTTPLPPDTYKMFEYLDVVRTGRSGVSPEAPGQNHMVGAETAHGVERLMSKKEELVGLVVRVIAETAIKPLVIRIRDLLIQNASAIKDYKFRGQWKQIDPSSWRERSMVTVRVGTGTGSQDRQVGALNKLAEAQTVIMQNPMQALVNEQKTFTLLDDLAKASGLTGAREYFVDPKSPEGQEQKQKVEKEQEEAKQKQRAIDEAFAKSQMELAKAEQMKAQAALENVKVKMQSEQVKAENESLKTNMAHAKARTDAQLTNQKQESDAQLTYQQQMTELDEKRSKLELEGVKLEMEGLKVKGEQGIKYDELQFKYDELVAKMKLEENKLEVQEQTANQNTAIAVKGQDDAKSMAQEQDTGGSGKADK